MQKSKTRIFINEKITKNSIIYIKNKQHHFLRNVLRAKINDQIKIFDGISGEWEAKVSAINRSNTILSVITKNHDLNKSSDIWLIFAPIKQNRMSIAIQKATELGVSKIFPCLTEYTNIRKINLKNLKDNAIESAEQCERLDIPHIEKLYNLEEILSNWPTNRKLIFCDEKLEKNELILKTLAPLNDSRYKFAVLIGPEGGFSESEKKLIKSNRSVVSISLGKRILRADTAITVALYCLQELTN